MKRLSGKQSYLGKALSRLVSTVSPIGKQGHVLYGPNEDDPLVPDLRIGHNDQWFKILTGDPSSAGQPLQIVNEPFTITVHHDPAEGADYTSLRDAVLYCAGFYRPPDLIEIFGTILIKSGHIIKSPTQIRDSDLSWVQILSEDNDVLVDSAETAGDPYFGGNGSAVFLVQNSIMPVLKAHFVKDGGTQRVIGFNLRNSHFTTPANNPQYTNQVDLDGVPGKRYGASGFEYCLILAGASTATLYNSAKFSNCGRDANVAVGGLSSLSLYGGDFTGYSGQASIRCGGFMSIGSLPQSTPLPLRTYDPDFGPYNAPDFRKDPDGEPAEHDILLSSNGQLSRRGGFYGTCNVSVNHTIEGVGAHFFHQSVRNPRILAADMFQFEPVTRKELLPPAGAYRNTMAVVREGYQDDGAGVLTVYLSDRGEWRPLQAGGLALPPPPTFTDNGDGTFTLS